MMDTPHMVPLRVNSRNWNYQAMIGVGGIGAGQFFALKGNRTLGREESRAGHFLSGRDYCKLHIISHYVKTLLGPEFATILVGKVGDDEIGHKLLDEMEQTGLDTRYIQTCPNTQTLYSICFIYPDCTGGNLTTDDSACTKVDVLCVAQAEHEFIQFERRGVVLAAPEVPIAAREKLLQLGTKYHFFRAASFISAEMQPIIEAGLIGQIDLLAINVDEAAAAVGIDSGNTTPESIVAAAVKMLSEINPSLNISITAGHQGSWSWDGKSVFHVPSFPAEAVSTAGAGDAHLAGMIAGISVGLTLHQAQELGSLVAALSVTSPHTIHPKIDRESLQAFSISLPIQLSPEVRYLIEI